MTIAQRYVGIDVSKHTLDIAGEGDTKPQRIANEPAAIAAFLATLERVGAFVVFEATGYYSRALEHALAQAGLAYAAVNPTRARDFARASAALAKTDAIDARLLAQMGRALDLAAGAPREARRERIAALSRRRDQLVAMRGDEARRLQVAADTDARDSQRHIAWLAGEIRALEALIRKALAADPDLAQTARVLKTAPGIALVGSAVLIAELPELGRRSGKTIAALAGLAPFNRDSGLYRGQRHIRGGRRRVRQALYMAAITAIRKVPRFTALYERVRRRSGHAKVALVAVARKLLIALNAMLKHGQPFRA